MGGLFDTIKDYMLKQKKAVEDIDKEQEKPKSRGIPEPKKIQSIDAGIKESEDAVAEIKKKGWVK
jgi:hypothetical protein